MKRLTRSFGVILCAGHITGACSILDPSFDRPALIIFFHYPTSLTAPDSAARGAPFTVTVRTFGGGCTRSTARAIVSVNGLLAEVFPYNKTTRCAPDSDLLYLNHTLSLTFDEPGVAMIRVHGEQEPFGGRLDGRGPAQLERQVTIH